MLSCSNVVTRMTVLPYFLTSIPLSAEVTFARRPSPVLFARSAACGHWLASEHYVNTRDRQRWSSCPAMEDAGSVFSRRLHAVLPNCHADAATSECYVTWVV